MIAFTLIAILCAAMTIYVISAVPDKRWSLGIAIALPILSLGLYLLLGAPGY